MTHFCWWCEREHGDLLASDPSHDAALTLAIAEMSLVHAFISRTTGPCCLCGAPTELYVLPIAGGAHLATPIVAHRGPGCIGPWVHNIPLMAHENLVARPLPCSDPACNATWERLRDSGGSGEFA